MAIRITGRFTQTGKSLATPTITGWPAGENAVMAGGQPVAGGGSGLNTIEHITISTAANSTEFGVLAVSPARYGAAGCSNNTRGLFTGGVVGAVFYNTIEYIVISSAGNSADFGDIIGGGLTLHASVSNGANDRGLYAGGAQSGWSGRSLVNYVNISSSGNGIDWGSISNAVFGLSGTSNGTNDRAIFAGGRTSGTTIINVIEYRTINTSGSATSFGYTDTLKYSQASTSNATNDRCLFIAGGSAVSGAFLDTITYQNFISGGNAASFGTVSNATMFLDATSNGTNERGVSMGGLHPDINTFINVIEYVTISSSPGAISATDFGDLMGDRSAFASTADGES